MDFLLVLLSIIVKCGLAYDHFDVYKPKHYPVAHESPQKENEITHIPVNYKDTKRIKYIDILSFLHNENSNRAVLAHVNKDQDAGDDDQRGRDGVEKTLADDENLIELVRAKRNSAMKVLVNLFQAKNRTAPIKTPEPPVYLKTSNDKTLNCTLIDLLKNLTEAIRTLNQNLVNLKTEAEKEGYVMIKMPLVNVKANLITNERNITRTKRDVSASELVDTNFKLNNYNDKVYINVAEKESDKDSKMDNQRLNTEDHRTDTTADISSKTYHLDVNKTKIEAYVTKSLGTTIKVNKTAKYETNIQEKYDLDPDKTKREINATLPSESINNEKSNNTEVNTTENIEQKSKQANLTMTETSDKFELGSSVVSAQAHVSDFYDPDEKAHSVSRDLGTYSLFKNEKDNDSITLSSKNREYIEHTDDNKEFHSIDQTYREIKDKMLPIKEIKDKYSSQTMYKVGYIVANLESLEAGLKKLKTRLGTKKTTWENNKLQNVKTTLNLTKRLVDNIINYLNLYNNPHFLK